MLIFFLLCTVYIYPDSSIFVPLLIALCVVDSFPTKLIANVGSIIEFRFDFSSQLGLWTKKHSYIIECVSFRRYFGSKRQLIFANSPPSIIIEYAD